MSYDLSLRYCARKKRAHGNIFQSTLERSSCLRTSTSTLLQAIFAVIKSREQPFKTSPHPQPLQRYAAGVYPHLFFLPKVHEFFSFPYLSFVLQLSLPFLPVFYPFLDRNFPFLTGSRRRQRRVIFEIQLQLMYYVFFSYVVFFLGFSQICIFLKWM